MSTVHLTDIESNLAFHRWATGEIAPYYDEPDFDGPTPEEEHEGHELMACMTLDSFSPAETFAGFLANQARLCNLRDGHPWFTWLGKQIGDLASRAAFLRAQTPEQYQDRDEALAGTSHAAAALDAIRLVARLTDAPCLADELRRSVEVIERT